jgi:hypothetical protein
MCLPGPRLLVRKSCQPFHLKPCPLRTIVFALGPQCLPFACVYPYVYDPKQESESEREDRDLQQSNIFFFQKQFDSKMNGVGRLVSDC